MQRIPRYRLLFGELIKNTPEDHPDYEPTAKALKKIEEVKKINQKIKFIQPFY